MTGNLLANPEIVIEREDDGALLFHPETGEIKLLNGSGAFLFGLLDGRHSKEDLVVSLLKEYAVERAEAEHDVEEFLRDMQTAHLAAESL